MAISVNWDTKVITVPQSYLTPVSANLYEMDINQFRLDLKDIEDSSEGMSFPDTHRHNTTTTISGTVLARVVEIINGYTVTFEYLGSPYAVNLIGANSNISEVTNINQVSIRSSNSAGMVVSGSGVMPGDITAIAQSVWDELLATHTVAGTVGERMQKLLTLSQFIALK